MVIPLGLVWDSTCSWAGPTMSFGVIIYLEVRTDIFLPAHLYTLICKQILCNIMKQKMQNIYNNIVENSYKYLLKIE